MPNIVEFNAPNDIQAPSDRGIGALSNLASEQNRFGREGGQALGSAIARVGGQVGEVLDKENYKRAQDAYQHEIHQQVSAGAVNYSAMYGNLSLGLNETMSKAPLNDTSVGAGFTEHTLNPTLDKFRASFDNAPEDVQKWADEQVVRTRQHFTERIIADSSTRAGMAVHENVSNIERNWSNAAMVDPSSMQFAIDSAKSAVNNLVDTAHNLSVGDAARVRGELLPKMEKSIAQAAFDAMAQANPREAKAALAHGDFNAYIDGATQAQWQRYADVQQKAQDADDRRDKLEAKQAAAQKSQEVADKYTLSMYDSNSGRMLRPNAKLNQQIMTDPDMLPAQKRETIRWNQTQYTAQVREDKASAAGSAVKDDPKILSDLRARVGSVDHPTTRQEVVDALSGELLTRKGAADLMWRVGKDDAAWDAVQRPFQHQFAVVKHALTISTEGQINPEKTAQRINQLEFDSQLQLRALYNAKDSAAIKSALDPTSKDYILRDSLIKPVAGSARVNVAQDAEAIRKGVIPKGGEAPKDFASQADAEKAGLKPGTRVRINGVVGTWQ